MLLFCVAAGDWQSAGCCFERKRGEGRVATFVCQGNLSVAVFGRGGLLLLCAKGICLSRFLVGCQQDMNCCFKLKRSRGGLLLLIITRI